MYNVLVTVSYEIIVPVEAPDEDEAQRIALELCRESYEVCASCAGWEGWSPDWYEDAESTPEYEVTFVDVREEEE